MGKPVATVGSEHICPVCKAPGKIVQGESNVLVNGKPVATIQSTCNCGAKVVTGTANILVNGKPITSVGDFTSHGSTIISGSSNVFIGESSSNPTAVTPIKEIPFPKITFINRITNNKGVKEFEKNKKRIEELDGLQPKIINYYYEFENKKINVDDIKPNQNINLVLLTQNADGKTLKINLNNKRLDFIYNNQIVENDILTGIKIKSSVTKVLLKAIETPKIISYHYEQNNSRIEVKDIKPNQDITLVILTQNANGKNITIDLNNNILDFKYNNKIIENDILRGIKITSAKTKIPLTTIEQKK